MRTIWRNYIQPHLNYASQLWSPGLSPELQNLENLLRTFTSWFSGSKNLNYWERLRKFKLNSSERRFERYKIILTWKYLEGLIPNCGISARTNPITGRHCLINNPKGRRSRIHSLRAFSFQVAGPPLFNCLPQSLRNISNCSVQSFKFHLDNYLQTIPDLPVVPGGDLPPPLDQLSARNSNSLRDWTRYLNLNVRRNNPYSGPAYGHTAVFTSDNWPIPAN